MLARTAGSLYWLGRYYERADFIARLVEATVRLDALSSRPAGEAAWESALAVTDGAADFAAGGQALSRRAVARFLTIDDGHPASICRCIEAARLNARAVRTALTRETWAAINRTWLLFAARPRITGMAETLTLVEAVEQEARGFEGALNRMLRNPALWFVQLGRAIERIDGTARLIDVKYHLLLPEGERVGGALDRDQWTTILQTVSAVTAYRWLYNDGLKPAHVIELLLARPELPRSIAASSEETVTLLGHLARDAGQHGEADRMARLRADRTRRQRASDAIVAGLHQHLGAILAENDALHAAIGRQFRFG